MGFYGWGLSWRMTMFKIIVSFMLLLLVGCSSSPEVKPTGIHPETQARFEQWKSLIDSGSHWPDLKKLTSVNDFVNQLNFVDDIVHWQQEDYWATPLQTLVTKGGDCEDFAIAKYFTLSAMGMNEDKMRLTYVKALTINKAHMVVSYYEQPNDEPLVLDNLNRNILLASQRKDLVPVYSFNGAGLWLAKRDRQEQHIDDSSRITLWQDLLHHMDVEAADQNAMICLYQYYDLPASKAKTLCP
jgi:predicted transglutaminase-like cysteine proteinase